MGAFADEIDALATAMLTSHGKGASWSGGDLPRMMAVELYGLAAPLTEAVRAYVVDHNVTADQVPYASLGDLIRGESLAGHLTGGTENVATIGATDVKTYLGDGVPQVNSPDQRSIDGSWYQAVWVSGHQEAGPNVIAKWQSLVNITAIGATSGPYDRTLTAAELIAAWGIAMDVAIALDSAGAIEVASTWQTYKDNVAKVASIESSALDTGLTDAANIVGKATSKAANIAGHATAGFFDGLFGPELAPFAMVAAAVFTAIHFGVIYV